MVDLNDGWTKTHDLALLYVALAYGTDHELSDGEVAAITDALKDWAVVSEDTHVQEIVMEAATAFIEGDANSELTRAIDTLGGSLGPDERRRALTDVIRIAEADGVLLEREQGLISRVADAWSLRRLERELMDESDAAVQPRGEDWGLIHELAFLFLVVAHVANNELAEGEITVILERLQEWQPDLGPEEAREIVRSSLQVYAEGEQEALIRDSMTTLKKALPDVQRLAVLDDLHCVARADGNLSDSERKLITSIARAWDVNVRLNGRHR
ncbi:TerB family tellurite resistance protein [Longibacter salinarum]|nr:TerB family tellurite resistance protein [Longibacter salinarum]